MENDYCIWEMNDINEYDYYNTSCGNSFSLNNDATLKENKIKYCPFCSKEIKEVKNVI